jgi:hypothetical protein
MEVLLLCAIGDAFNSWKGSERYYRIGKVGVGIVTVRFGYRRKGKDIYYEERL